jgi:hypothetical protein
LAMADPKKKRGNPTPKKFGPKFEKERDLHDPSKPKCNASYRDRWGTEKRCGKRGYHWRHGPGRG